MIVEHVFKHGKERFEPRQPKMERSSKGPHERSPMLLSHSSRGDNSTQDGKTRTNTQHKSIPVTKKNFSQIMRALRASASSQMGGGDSVGQRERVFFYKPMDPQACERNL